MAGLVASTQILVYDDRNTQFDWDVYVDYAGGTNYALEGSFSDANHSQGTSFGFVPTYTTTRGDKFFFDNVRISPILTDTTPPNLLSATAINATQVNLQFDEPISSISASTLSNFSISSPYTISNAQLSASNNQVVELTVSTLSSGTNWVYAQGVEDANGNAMTLDSASFSFIQTQLAVRGDILINEIHADPTPVVGLPDAEYIELYNISNKSINLASFIFNDGVNRFLPGFILQPDSLVVLTSSAYVSLFSSYGTVLDIGSLSLINGGETYALQRSRRCY